MTPRRRYARTMQLWRGLALSVLCLVIAPLPAHGHARYVASDPADGEQVSTAPSEVWAEYSEPLEPDSHMEVYGPCGQRVDTGDVRVTGYRMTVSMSSDFAGTHVVAWTAASAIDPHVTEGNFTFTVAQGVDCNAGSSEEPSDDGGDTGGRDAGRRARGDDGSSSSRVAAPARERGENDPARRTRAADRKRMGKHAHHRSRRGDRGVRATNLAVQDAPLNERRRDGDLPVPAVLAALGLAALIGASGGWVYAGLLGPRR